MKTICPSREILLFVFSAVLLFRSMPSQAQTETHPCILYLAQERETIRNRLVKNPYAGWRDQLILQADTILKTGVPWDGTGVPKITQAYYAKLLASAFVFSDSSQVNHNTYGSEASKALANVPDASFTKYFTSDLDISEAAVYWAEAYDMLKGENFDFTLGGTTQDIGPVIRGRLAKLRAYMAKNNPLDIFSTSIARDFTSCIFFDVAHTDNHHVKLQSALVVLSLSILSESGSAGDLATARSRLVDALGNLTITGDNGEPAGGWAEGPNYHLYSAQQYLPALIALKNMNIFDFTTVPELVETHLWLPRIVMPDALTPPFNDNEAAYFDLTGLLYSLHRARPDRDALFWMWNQYGRAVSPMFLPDYIARFDETPPAHADPGALGWTPTGFYPESGFARFRDSWNSNSIYLQFLCKHGDALVKGQAHNHPDPNSFILHAFGNMLLMDSGYGGFAEHDSTRFARNHNLILIDGNGPQEASKDKLGFWNANSSNAYFEAYFTSPGLDFAMSNTIYQNTDFYRTVLFPSHRYFFLYDRLSTGKISKFTLLLHGNGGGTSGGTFTSLDSGARWEQDKASVRTFTVGSSPLTFAASDMKHAVYSRSPFLSHTVLHVSQTASDPRFLTLLFPDRKGASSPSIAEATVTHGKGIRLSHGDTTDYGAMRTDNSALTLSTVKGSYSSDGECFLASFDSPEKLSRYSVINGAFVTSGQDTLFRSKRPVNMTAGLENPNAIEGYLQAITETTVSFTGVNAVRVLFQGKEIPSVPFLNTVSFTILGEGLFRVEGTVAAQTLKPPGNVSVADVPNDNGHRLRLTWSKSPSESGGLVDWYRIYRSRNPVMTDPILFPKNVTVDSLLALENMFTVLVDSVKAGITEYIDGVYYNGAPYYYWIQAVGSGAKSPKAAAHILTWVESKPSGFWVGDPYPNPFNPVSQINYFIPEDARVTISVYTVTGQRAAILRDEVLKAGRYSCTWFTNGIPSGIYFLKISAGNHSAIKKMALVK